VSNCKHQGWNADTGKCLECGISYVSALNGQDAEITRLTKQLQQVSEARDYFRDLKIDVEDENKKLRAEHDEWVDILNESKGVVELQREERLALREKVERLAEIETALSLFRATVDRLAKENETLRSQLAVAEERETP
jgi:predicted  nucleic acid-binding Zn-ribbon protein